MRLSIITINYNNAEGLRHTLDSVASQTYREFEHIIIDGESTDNSVDVIKEYVAKVDSRESIVDSVIWSSESDRGVYDAMNKGVKKASGEYLYFLNSGDTLSAPSILHEIVDYLNGYDIVIGRVNKTINGRIIGQSELLSEKDMSLYNMYLRGINHQSAFIKRSLLIDTPYDASIRLGADWKFFVQTIVLGDATTKFIDLIFANYDVTGISSNTTEVRKERENLLKTIMPERIARDYIAVASHYYELIRLEWLLKHPFWYKVYREWTTLGRKLIK